MNIVIIDIEKDFAPALVEHFFRVAALPAKGQVRGRYNKEWYDITHKWLKDNCTEEEYSLILEFYANNITVRNYKDVSITSKIKSVIHNFSTKHEFW